MGDFASWYVQKYLPGKGASEETQSQDEGKRIDFWNRLSPEQKEALSIGSLTQEAERSNLPQLDYRLRPSDFTVVIPERHHKQFDRDSQTKLIQEYLDAVEEVAKNRELPTEEKLKKLLIPLVNLCNITFPTGYDSRLEFIEEDINPKEELELENLISNPEKYAIIGDEEFQVSGLLRVRSKCIWLSEKYALYLSFCGQVKAVSEAEFEKMKIAPKPEKACAGNTIPAELEVHLDALPDYHSISDIYKLWLPSLTPEKMKSNDLLDRILVTHTIKRALNQDEKAINKLFGLFQGKAEAVAAKMTKKRGLKEHIDDVKQEAGILLWSMIKGFSAKQILDGLSSDVNFTIPKTVKELYLYWLSEEVPKRLSGFPLIDPLDVAVLLDPAILVHSTTRRKLSPVAIRMFNSLSYRPSSKTNLYTWLFGTNDNPMQGRFCQEISECLDKLLPKQEKKVDEDEGYEDKIRQAQIDHQSKYIKKEKPIRTDENDPDEGVDESAIVGDYIPEAPDESERGTFEVMVSKYKPSLLKHGISERDAIIILSCLSGERTNAEMAKEYNLHKSTIEQVIHRCKPILKKILETER